MDLRKTNEQADPSQEDLNIYEQDYKIYQINCCCFK